MLVEWVALGTGIVGAASGLASLGWNVRSWKREGPVLRVTARVSGHADQMTVSGQVRNAGRFETTITAVHLIWVPFPAISAVKEKGLSGAGSVATVPSNGHLFGISLPQLVKPQSAVEYLIIGLAAIDPRIPGDVAANATLRVSFETAVGEFIGHTIGPKRPRS